MFFFGEDFAKEKCVLLIAVLGNGLSSVSSLQVLTVQHQGSLRQENLTLARPADYLNLLCL